MKKVEAFEETILRRISSAAARTKPSRPALTIETDALPGIGCIESMPVVRVIEPPSRIWSFAIRASETCPISLPEVIAQHAGTVKVLYTLRPFAVAMAGAGEFDPFKD